MRKSKIKKGLKVNAIAGTYVVLLGLDLPENLCKRLMGFSIHRVEHRYVAFQVHDAKTIIIAGFFHESMDIPNRLLELQSMTQPEMDALKRRIASAGSTRKG